MSAVRGGGPLGVTGVVIPVVMAAPTTADKGAAPGSGPARRGARPAVIRNCFQVLESGTPVARRLALAA